MGDGAPPPATVISPDGYGPVRIGMTLPEAEAALGVELVEDGPLGDPEVCKTYHRAGDDQSQLGFMIAEGRLVRVSDYDAPDGLTPEGVGAGSRAGDVLSAYPDAIRQPPPYASPPAHDLIVWRTPDVDGLRFEIDADGVVRTLHAGGRAILAIEGCF